MGAILTGSLIYLAIGVIGCIVFGLIARTKTTDVAAKSSNFCTAIFSVILGTVCMWMMWVSAYMHQMHPIIFPQINGSNN